MHEAPPSVSRRAAIAATAGVALLAGCSKGGGKPEVSPTEDLMREHGVLRRVLIAYRETAPALRAGPAGVDAAALAEAAQLFRSFGEDYHEKMEEQYVFPAVQKLGGDAGAMVATLLIQHARGRQITDFIQAKSASGRIGAADAEPLALALETFARMYEAHTAFEDTVAFQAWRQSMSDKERDAAGDQFEKIERSHFAGGGFEMAVDQVAQIEQKLGLHDLARYTAGPVPAA